MRLGNVYLFGTNQMLTGADLLSKVNDLGDVSKSDLVKACGEAKGVNLASGGGAGIGKGGRKLSYVATVQGNGNLLVGKAYTAMLNLNPGDEFDIKLGKKAIRLIPVGGSEEEETTTEEG